MKVLNLIIAAAAIFMLACQFVSGQKIIPDKVSAPAIKNKDASEKEDIRVKKMLEQGKVKYEVNEDDGDFKITVNTTQGRTQTVFIESKTKVYEGFEVRRISSIGYDAKGLFPIDAANILLADNARPAIGAWEINKVEKNKYIALYVAKVPTTLTYEQFFYTIGIVAGIADEREKDLMGKDRY
ncbi:MAG: hypothetical protein ACR2N3_17010 [Pyrinomonadaceae bacterium]